MSKRLWKKLKGNQANYPVNWDKMYDNIRSSEFKIPDNERTVKTKRWPAILGMAAVIILLTTGGTLYYLSGGHKVNEVTALADTNKTKEDKPAFQTIEFPDGSIAKLFGDSKLEYTSFSLTSREVHLIGHGYFDIAPDPAHPFIVHTGKISTRVLGTSFYVRAYPGDESIEVKVKSGKVQVLNEQKPLGTLTAKQMISFKKTTEDYVQQTIGSKPLATEKETEIKFDNISMEEAAARISEWFLTDIEFTNPEMMKCSVTATFSKEDSLQEILTVICGVLKADYQINEDKIIIDGQGCIH